MWNIVHQQREKFRNFIRKRWEKLFSCSIQNRTQTSSLKLSTPYNVSSPPPLPPFIPPPFWLLHFDSVLVLWNLTVESILSETKWYFTLAAVSCCNFPSKHLYSPALPFKTPELSYCVVTEWSAGRGNTSREEFLNKTYVVVLVVVCLIYKLLHWNFSRAESYELCIINSKHSASSMLMHSRNQCITMQYIN